MASIYFNPLLPNSFGRVVLKRRGKTVYFARPSTRTSPRTPAERRQSQRFAEASIYGKGIFARPHRRAPYEAQARAAERPVFAVIMADLLRAPLLHAVDADGYQGRVGDAFLIRTRADLPVTTVTVTLQRDDGSIVETGNASLAAGAWRYVATQAVPAGTALTLEVKVIDADHITLRRTSPLIVARA